MGEPLSGKSPDINVIHFDPKSNKKFVERDNIDTSITQINDRSWWVSYKKQELLTLYIY
jgi:hypothetical protein